MNCAKAMHIINYIRYYYKIGFALADFAQLEAHVSVLNTLKVGWAKPCCSVG